MILLPSVKIRRGCNVNVMFGLKERSQTTETYTIVIQTKICTLGFSIFNFRSMRRYGQNKTIHILYGSLWGPYKACVSGSYMDAVFELVVHKESEIWPS